MTLIIGLLCIAIALLMVGGKNDKQFRYMITLFSLATAPVGIPMLLGLRTRRVTNAAALAGFVAGVLVGLTMFFHYPDRIVVWGQSWLLENLILLATTFATLIVMMLVSVAFPANALEWRT